MCVCVCVSVRVEGKQLLIFHAVDVKLFALTHS